MQKKIFGLIWIVSIIMTFAPMCLAWGNGIDVHPSAVGDVQSNVETVLGTIQWIGFIVAIAMLIYVGIKYLTSGAGKKAEAKDTLIPMLIGAVLVALAPTIASAVFKTFENGSSSSTGGGSSSSSTGGGSSSSATSNSNTNVGTNYIEWN